MLHMELEAGATVITAVPEVAMAKGVKKAVGYASVPEAGTAELKLTVLERPT
jgi:hypothetical protein